MKNKIFVVAVVGIMAAMISVGLLTNSTHTDITSREDFQDRAVVAEFPHSMAEICFQNTPELLDEAEYIVKVKAISGLQSYGRACSQDVEIMEIYRGEGLEEGQNISLVSDRWTLEQEADTVSIERGFINILQEDQEYLVFGQSLSEVFWKDISVMSLYDGGMIVPVFGYEEGEAAVAEHNEQSTYVSYSMVKNNEFFGSTEEEFDRWRKMKSEILAKYVK